MHIYFFCVCGWVRCGNQRTPFFFLFLFFVFPHRVSLCIPGCPRFDSVDQVGLEPRDPACCCFWSVGIRGVHHHWPARGSFSCHVGPGDCQAWWPSCQPLISFKMSSSLVPRILVEVERELTPRSFSLTPTQAEPWHSYTHIQT